MLRHLPLTVSSSLTIRGFLSRLLDGAPGQAFEKRQAILGGGANIAIGRAPGDGGRRGSMSRIAVEAPALQQLLGLACPDRVRFGAGKDNARFLDAATVCE